MKLRNVKLTVGTRLKPKKQRPEHDGAKFVSPPRQTLPNGSSPVQKIQPFLTLDCRADHPQPPSAAAARFTETAKASTGARLRHFELVAPDARTVFLTGSFNQWDPSATRLIHLAEGKWVTDLSLLPGRYEYLFVVNGNYWTPDPRAREYASNPFGGYNSVLEVPASS